MNYKYGISACDVVDKDALKAFRSKRNEWLLWLNDGDTSIWQQIYSMMSNDRLYWIVNEARRIGGEQGGEFAARSGWLAELINQGFCSKQLLSLRRLMEPPAHRPHRQVVSLSKLLADIEAHRELFTRENYVAFDGLRFDPADAEQRYWASAPQVGAHYEPIGGPKDSSSSRRLHSAFDAIGEVGGSRVDREQVMRQEVLDALVSRLESAPFDEAKVIADKQIAHAADPSTLPEGGIPGIAYKQIWECQQRICEVAGFISTFIVHDATHGVVPAPQSNVFHLWDRPFIPSDAAEELSDIWDETEAERNRWGNEHVSEMLKEFREDAKAKDATGLPGAGVKE